MADLNLLDHPAAHVTVERAKSAPFSGTSMYAVSCARCATTDFVTRAHDAAVIVEEHSHADDEAP
jgi:hypothetical protein